MPTISHCVLCPYALRAWMSHANYITLCLVPLRITCLNALQGDFATSSPQLCIFFCKRASNHRALLRKMTYKDKGSYTSSPPTSDLTHQICVTWRTHTRDTSHSYQKCALMLYSVAKTHQMSVPKTRRIPYLYRSFSAKEPYNYLLSCRKRCTI